MTAPLTIGSLFAGIGGFDIAAEFYGWRTSWFVERDSSCQHWLAEHFPGRPIYGDITQVDFTDVEAVDLLCGGFPCQPASAAGKRLGTADDRWLWPHFARAIGSLRPRWVVAENVPGLLSVNGGRAFAEVLRDLAALGYDAEWSDLSAADVGAPHSRERAWVVAHAASSTGARVAGVLGAHARVQGDEGDEPAHGILAVGDSNGRRREQSDAEQRECGKSDSRHSPVGDADSEWRRWESERPRLIGTHGGIAGRSNALVSPWADGVAVRGADGTVRLIPREAAEAGPESPLWPVADGIPGRVARLRAIGNAVVPQCVIEGPFRLIAEREAAREVAA